MAICPGGQRKLRNGSWYSYHYRKGKAGHYYNNDCDNDDDDYNDYHNHDHRTFHNDIQRNIYQADQTDNHGNYYNH